MNKCCHICTVLFAVLSSHAIAQEVDYQKIFNWSEPNCLQKVEVRKGLSVNLCGWPDQHPGTCLKMIFARYKSGAERWPAVIWKVPEIPSDWSAADAISFDIYAAKKGLLRLHFVSSNGAALQRMLPVPVGRSRLRVPLIEGTFDYKNMQQLHILMQDPEDDFVFYVGNLELEIRNFQKLFQQFQNKLEVASSADLDTPKNAELRAKVQNCQKRLKAAIDKKSPLTPSCWNDYKRVVTALLYELQEDKIALLTGDKKVQALFAGSMEKVHQRDNFFINIPSLKGEMMLAGNEAEAIQVVIRSEKQLSKVSVTWKDIPENNLGEKLPVSALSIMPVGYVRCDKPCYGVSRSGLWPDPLLNYSKSLDINANEWQAFWVEVSMPPRQKPGIYQGHLAIKSGEKQLAELPVTVKVYNFSLPEGIPYQNVISLPSNNFIKNPFTKKRPYVWKKKCMNTLLSHRVNPTSLYTWRPSSAKEAGNLIKRGMLSFNVRYGLGSSENYIEGYIASLKNAYVEYEKAGIADKAYCYVFDEAQVGKFPEIRRILLQVKKAVPQAKFMTTAYDSTLGLDSPLKGVIDAYVPAMVKYEFMTDEIAKARQHGTQVWFYVACGTNLPYASFLIEYPSMCVRLLMGGMIWKYRPDGFLHYSSALWLSNAQKKLLGRAPMKGAPVTNWTGRSFGKYNGDGLLIYPGENGPVPTLRLKQIRDGIEDYWYFTLLKQALADSSQMSEQWRQNAGSELQIKNELIHTMTDYAQNPNILLTKRVRIAKLLEEYYEKNK